MPAGWAWQADYMGERGFKILQRRRVHEEGRRSVSGGRIPLLPTGPATGSMSHKVCRPDVESVVYRAGHAAGAAHAIGINPEDVQRTIYIASQVVSTVEQNQAGRSFLVVPMDLPQGAFPDDFNFWNGSDGAGLCHGVLRIKVTRREQPGGVRLNGC